MKLLKNSFKEDLEFFKQKILNNENFAFARYADGERMILNNEPILYSTQAYSIDKWIFNNNLIFAQDLKDTCNHRENNYYYAISCKCCDPQGEVFFKNKFENHNITFSNLFINANYHSFIKFIETLKDKNIFMIANKNSNNSVYPFNVIDRYLIEDDCVNWYENNKIQILNDLYKISEKYNNTIFFISAGPLSEIIIHNLFNYNPNNSYIDVGSSLDIYTHKKITRPYQILNSEYNIKECRL